MDQSNTANAVVPSALGEGRRRRKTYRRMINLAIRNMQDRSGCSKDAIVKHITENNREQENLSIDKINRALNLMTSNQTLIKCATPDGQSIFKVNENRKALLPSAAKSRRRKVVAKRGRRAAPKRKHGKCVRRRGAAPKRKPRGRVVSRKRKTKRCAGPKRKRKVVKQVRRRRKK